MERRDLRTDVLLMPDVLLRDCAGSTTELHPCAFGLPLANTHLSEIYILLRVENKGGITLFLEQLPIFHSAPRFSKADRSETRKKCFKVTQCSNTSNKHNSKLLELSK